MSQSYAHFLNILRSPGCKDILGSIRAFIRKFEEFSHSGANALQLSHIYSNYLKGQILPSLLENRSFRAQCGVLSCPPSCVEDDHLHNCPNYLLAKDGLEYMITSQIHPFSFHTTEDEATNDWLNRKIVLLSTFIGEENLDIQAEEEEVSLAVEELFALPSLKTPFDLKNLLLNVCRILNSSTKATSTDLFLPTLIWTLIRANVKDLHFVLLYIKRYEIYPVLEGSDAFLWTAIEASKSFLIDCDHLSFTTKDGHVMDAVFYELQMSEADKRIEMPPPPKPTSRKSSPLPQILYNDQMSSSSEDEESIQDLITTISKDSFTALSKWVGEAQERISKKLKPATSKSCDGSAGVENNDVINNNSVNTEEDIEVAIKNSLETKEVEDAFEKDNVIFSDCEDGTGVDGIITLEPEEGTSSIINDYYVSDTGDDGSNADDTTSSKEQEEAIEDTTTPPPSNSTKKKKRKNKNK